MARHVAFAVSHAHSGPVLQNHIIPPRASRTDSLSRRVNTASSLWVNETAQVQSSMFGEALLALEQSNQNNTFGARTTNGLPASIRLGFRRCSPHARIDSRHMKCDWPVRVQILGQITFTLLPACTICPAKLLRRDRRLRLSHRKGCRTCSSSLAALPATSATRARGVHGFGPPSWHRVATA